MSDPGTHRDLLPRPEHHHREVNAGSARAAVFGVSDGLVSNVGLVLGLAGAHAGPHIVRVAGLFGLVAGALSMAAGEYNSMQVQRELFERELELERREIRRNPHVETVELTQIYQARGIPPDRAREMAQALMSDPEQALQVHAREELGIDPDALGSPIGAAIWSFLAFAVGAFVPVLPWLWLEKGAAIMLSLGLALTAAVAVGVATTRFTQRSYRVTVGRQVGLALFVVLVTYVPAKLLHISAF